jgi:hypothetical protein
MAVAFSADTDDDGTGQTGTIHNAAWKAAMATQIDALVGDWTAWTPTIGGSTSQSGQVYSLQVGRYKKTSKGIEFYGSVTLSTLGTITGNVQIKGLPTAETSTAGRSASVYLGFFSGLTTSYVWLGGFIAVNTTAITLQGLTAAATGTSNLAQANLSATTSLTFAGFYEID